MLIDVFSERGFHATVDVTRVGVPLGVDLQTGKIYSEEKKVFRFSVRFRNPEIQTSSSRTSGRNVILMFPILLAELRHCSSGIGFGPTKMNLLRLYSTFLHHTPIH